MVIRFRINLYDESQLFFREFVLYSVAIEEERLIIILEFIACNCQISR